MGCDVADIVEVITIRLQISKGRYRLGVGAQKWVGVEEIYSSHW
jgi:hypothetical protein